MSTTLIVLHPNKTVIFDAFCGVKNHQVTKFIEGEFLASQRR